MTDSLARTSSTGKGRVRSNVSEPLANRLESLASEASNIIAAVPKRGCKRKLGTPPPPRRQPLGRWLGKTNDRNHTSSQPSTNASKLPATTPVQG